MRNFKVIVIALALSLAVGCKKKKAEDTGTASGMAGSGMAGSGMAGSGMAGGSDMAVTPDAAVAVEPPKALVNMAAADLKWVPLDEKAGDKGPMVSWLYGDAMKEPNGFFLKVGAANKGMWHTHSSAYHGVVVSGAPNHLQDGETKAKPLPAPSYWFEPAGAAHNSQCLGKDPCVVFVHFNEGKFDFAPAEMKKDGKPDPTYVEKREKDLKWSPLVPEAGDKGPMLAVAWGDPASGPSGGFIKVPAGMVSPAHSHSADYHGVVIKGTVMNYAAADKAPKEMGPGSYWMQPGGGNHITACKAGSDCVSYVYSVGKFDMAMAPGADMGAGAGSAGSAAHDMKDMKHDMKDMKHDMKDMKKDMKDMKDMKKDETK